MIEHAGIASDKDITEAMFKMALQYQFHQEWDAAEGMYRGLMRSNPELASVRINLATVLRIKAKTRGPYSLIKEAGNILVDLAEKHPTNPSILLNLGNILSDLALRDKQKLCGSLALRLYARCPQTPQVLMARGKMLHGMDEYEDALVLFNQCIQAKPDFAEAYANRGMTLMALGRYSEAAWSDYDKRLLVKRAT